MPASRSARAMIFAPRSCPSRPGFATTTRIFLPPWEPPAWAVSCSAVPSIGAESRSAVPGGPCVARQRLVAEVPEQDVAAAVGVHRVVDAPVADEPGVVRRVAAAVDPDLLAGLQDRVAVEDVLVAGLDQLVAVQVDGARADIGDVDPLALAAGLHRQPDRAVEGIRTADEAGIELRQAQVTLR